MEENIKSANWRNFTQFWPYFVGRYARFVSRKPWPFIIFPCILTSILSSGFLQGFKIVRSIDYLYTPLDARWKSEERVFYETWTKSDQRSYPGKDTTRRKCLYLIVEAIDRGNILRPKFANEFVNLLDWMVDTRISLNNGQEYTYRNVCLQFQSACFTNEHARFVADVFRNGDAHMVNISYPIFKTKYSVESIDLSNTLGNAKTDSTRNLLSASAWLIFYQLKQDSDDAKKLSSEFEISMSEKIKRGHVPRTLLNIYYLHSNSFDIELEQSSWRLIPSFIITFIILVSFSVLSTFSFRKLQLNNKPIYVIDWIISKPFMGLIGVLITLMAIVSAIGLLLLIDVPFVDMVTVMPFLSLTIGIDDTFLMIAAWHETDRRMPVDDRIEICMRHAAASISITSLTDAIAFAIGAIAPLPAVIYFCYYSSVAIFFIFIYSLTIFIAFLSIQGHWEEQHRNNLFYCKCVPFEEIDAASMIQIALNLGSGLRIDKSNEKQKVDRRLWYQNAYGCTYATFITSKPCQIVSVVLFIAYICFGVIGLQRIEIGFDAIDLIQNDSPTKRFWELRSEFFPRDLSRLDIAVKKVPNMINYNERIQFMAALNEFIEINCTQDGPLSIDFWYFEYENYIRQMGFGDYWVHMNNDQEGFYAYLELFLLTSDKYRYDIFFNNITNEIQSFRLSIQLKANMDNEQTVNCARTLRSLADRTKNTYDITIFTTIWILADQLEIIWPQTLQDAYISIGIMMLTSLILIRDIMCTVNIGLNLLSISIGMLGYMAWLGITLDASSMITIAISVGFSVDFTAHITFAYVNQPSADEHHLRTPAVRLSKTLEAVGWPITQASLSVFLGILPLAFVDSRIIRRSFETVTLVIFLGTTHALLFLPIFMMNLHKIYGKLFSKGL